MDFEQVTAILVLKNIKAKQTNIKPNSLIKLSQLSPKAVLGHSTRPFLTSADGVFVFTDKQTDRRTWQIIDQISPEGRFGEYVYFKYNMYNFSYNTVHKVINFTLPPLPCNFQLDYIILRKFLEEVKKEEPP